VERWLAELALALRQETYRPEPKSSPKPHVLQSLTRPRRAAQITVMRAVLSTTINRKTVTVIPSLIVSAEVVSWSIISSAPTHGVCRRWAVVPVGVRVTTPSRRAPPPRGRSCPAPYLSVMVSSELNRVSVSPSPCSTTTKRRDATYMPAGHEAAGLGGTERKVRIHLPPADSPSLTGSSGPGSRTPAFRAGLRAMEGGAVGRDEDRPATWRRPATMSLLSQIPVPQCQ